MTRRHWAAMESANSPANPTARRCGDRFPGVPPVTCSWWGVSASEGDFHADQGRHWSSTITTEECRYQIRWEYPDLIDYDALYKDALTKDGL